MGIQRLTVEFYDDVSNSSLFCIGYVSRRLFEYLVSELKYDLRVLSLVSMCVQLINRN